MESLCLEPAGTRQANSLMIKIFLLNDHCLDGCSSLYISFHNQEIKCHAQADITVAGVRGLLIKKQLLHCTEPLYLAYERHTESGVDWKYKRVSPETHIIGIAERYKNALLIPWKLDEYVAKPYRR